MLYNQFDFTFLITYINPLKFLLVDYNERTRNHTGMVYKHDYMHNSPTLKTVHFSSDFNGRNRQYRYNPLNPDLCRLEFKFGYGFIL